MKVWSRWQDWVNAVVGMYLFFSPWILDFSAVTYAVYNAWVLGVAVLASALCALSRPESEGPEWCNAVLGLFVVLVPWVVGFANPTYPAWGFVLSGLIVLALSALVVYDIRSGPAQLARK